MMMHASLCLSRSRAAAALWVCLLACVLACVSACGDDLPEPATTGTVSGTIRYGGTAHLAFTKPTLSVSAFAAWPPDSAPYALVELDASKIQDGIAYTLTGLPDFQYHLVAVLFDGAKTLGATDPTGAFPNACALAPNQPPPVVIAQQNTLQAIDVTVYDTGGSADPCFSANTDKVCPEDGAASLLLTVTTGVDPSTLTADDAFIYGLFSAWPPRGAPTAFKLLASADILPTIELTDLAVPPGDHFVYVCVDKGGDDLMGVCGDEDLWMVFSTSAPLTLTAGQIQPLALDLTSQTGDAPPALDPATVGCAAP